MRDLATYESNFAEKCDSGEVFEKVRRMKEKVSQCKEKVHQVNLRHNQGNQKWMDEALKLKINE